MSHRVSKWLLVIPLVIAMTSCGSSNVRPHLRNGLAQALTTYEKFLPLAADGDSEFQNLVGFMLFHGEGVERDLVEAHRWFHLAAGSGNNLAQRNDLYMHNQLYKYSSGEVVGSDRRRAKEDVLEKVSARIFLNKGLPIASDSSGRVVRGEKNYTAFCAGCHGLNGVAAYVNSPSFAIGERLEKSDAALFRSVSNGIGDMPGWGGKLSDQDLIDTVIFVRMLGLSYEVGSSHSLRNVPARYFLFGVMMYDHSAYGKE